MRRSTVGLIVLVVLAGCAGTPTDSTSTTAPTPPNTTTGQASLGTGWTVEVVEVTDGDTMDVRLPNGSIATIRLLGVDTPETSVTQVTPDEWEGIPDTVAGRDWLANWGGKASAYARDRLAGEQIYIAIDPEADTRGYYGRLLVYAYQSQEATTSFNRRLLEGGYARLYESTFTKRSTFAAIETSAQNANTGVWGFDSESPATTTTTRPLAVVSVHADAAGNDHENLDDEYVTLENTGASTLAMGGWTIADGAGHTYTVPTGFELAPSEQVTLYTGAGTNTASSLYWGANSAIWNNGGDRIVVTNATGKTILEHTCE